VDAGAGTPEWLGQVAEEVVNPAQRIIDPHHHLWPEGGALPYSLADLQADVGGGHKVIGTVFVECHAAYDKDCEPRLGPVGETRFVAENAAAVGPDQTPILGIVAHADLTLAAGELHEVLDAHAAAGGELFKGIRDAGARDDEPEALTIAGRGAPDCYADPDFRNGMAILGDRGLSYDTWHYHHQNAAFAELAAAVPQTTMVLDHFGTPLGVGRFAGKHDEIFESWKDDIAAIAANPNVVAKLGGLAMPDNGFGWHEQPMPPTSDEFVAAQERWYLHTIDCFGPDRCMFESNFPVDRFSISYNVLWNGLKKIAQRFAPDEQDQMFFGTANRVYGLDLT